MAHISWLGPTQLEKANRIKEGIKEFKTTRLEKFHFSNYPPTMLEFPVSGILGKIQSNEEWEISWRAQ